jgi:glutamate-1-semialdehyde aminotransferase
MHPLAMAAARAVLNHLKSAGPRLQQKLNERTTKMVAVLNDYFQASGVPIQLANFGSLFGPASVDKVDKNVAAINPFFYSLLNEGVLIHGRGFLSTAHTDDDIDYLVRRLKDCVEGLQASGLLPSPNA